MAATFGKFFVNSTKLILILMLVMSVLPAAPVHAAAEGRTFYVDITNEACSDESGSPGSTSVPLCTIGEGSFRATQPGDTVWVLAGTYPETVQVKNSGVEGSPITFKGDPGVTITGKVNPETKDNSAFLFSGRSYIVITGFTITETRGKGIHVLNSDHITITNNHVHHAGDPSDPSLHVQGIVLNNTDYSIVANNITDHNTCIGIRIINGSDYNLISENRSFANASIVVRDAAGIELNGASYNTVIGNIAYGNEDSGINVYWNQATLVPSSYNVLVGNLTYGNGDHGIDHNHSPYNTVIGNTIHGNGTVGLNFEGSTEDTGSHHATVYNNIIVNNGYTPVTGAAGGNIRVDKVSDTGTVLDYNIVNQAEAAYGFVWDGIKYTSLAAFRAEVPTQMVHGLEADPMFIAPVKPVLRDDNVIVYGSDVTGVYYLKPGSPAIDSAFSDAPNQLLVDLDGNPRVDAPATPNTGAGARSYDDIGVYEFQPSHTIPAVTTGSITSVTRMSAVASGSVTAMGVPNPVQHGVVWDTEANPTINDDKSTDGPVSNTGSFSCNLTGLTPGTVYYLRAYAINAADIVYGDEVTFTTLKPVFVPMISSN